MSQIRKHSIKGITDVLASTDAASKSYFDSINKLSPGPSGFDYNTTIVENNYSSSNFDNWAIRTLSDNISSNTIRYLAGAVSDEYYVIGGNSGIQNIQKSTDGTIWSAVGASAPGPATTIGDIIYSGEYYFVSPQYAVSTDTVVWSLRTSGDLLDVTQAAGYGGGVYLTLGRGSDGAFTSIGKISASTDTIHWTYRTSAYSTNTNFANSYAYHSGTNTHVAGGTGLNGSGGEIHISTDSVVWTVALTVGSTNFDTTYYDSENQLILSAGVNSELYVSTDTLSWSARTIKGAIGLGKQVNSIAWDSRKKLYYLATGRVFASSTDSIVWTEESSPLSADNTSAYILSSDRNNSTILFSNDNEIATSLSLLDSNPGRFLSIDYDDIFVEQETNLEELGFVNDATFNSYPDDDAGVYGSGYFLQFFYWSDDSNLNKLAASTDGNQWVVRTFDGIGVSDLYAAAYGNGYYLMAGRSSGSNTLHASTDTIVWEKRTSGITGSLDYDGASYGNGIYILNQTGPKIHASTDTVVWSLRDVPFSFSGGINYSGYGDGYHVVFGSSSNFIVSTDSVVWTNRTCGVLSTVSSYSYGNGIHLIQPGNSLFASTDTVVWVARTTPSDVGGLAAYDPTSKKYTYFRNGNFTERIYQSTDSIHWENDGTIFESDTSREISTLNFNNDDNYFLAVVEPGLDSPKVYKKQSPQKVWQSASDSESSIRGFKEFYYTGSEETFVLPSGSNNYYIELIGGGGGGASADTDSSPKSGGSGSSSQYNSFKIERSEIGDTKQFNIYVGAGGLGGDARGCSSSTDNLNWDTVIDSIGSATNWEDIAYGNGTYVICGSSGRLITSTDTNTWILRTSGTTSGSIGIVYGNGIYALINSSQTSARISTDGIVWIARTSQLVVPQDIQYINNAFFACGSSSSMVVSSDGVIWQRRTTGANSILYRVGYSENDSKYFACGNSRVVIDSTDSITWVLRTSGQDYTGSDVDVNYLNGIYILAASRQILVSTDFISWQSRTFDTSASTSASVVRRGIAYFNGNYSIAGKGDNGYPEYLVSTDTIVWESRGRRRGYSTENKIIHNRDINNLKVINDKIFILANAAGQGETSENSYVQWTSNDGATLRGITSPNGSSAPSNGSAPSTILGSKNAFFSSVIRNGDSGSTSSDYGDYLQSNQTSSYEIVASSPGLWGSSDVRNKNTIYYYGNEYIQKSEPSIVAPGTYWNESPKVSFDSSRALTYGKYSYVSEGGNEWTSRTSGVVNNINSVSSSLGEYLTVGTDVLQSTDNVHWTLRSSQGSYNSSRHSDSANVFNNRIVDGDVSIWTLRTIGYTNNNVNEVLYSPSAINNYVVASPGGEILSSTDTIQWTIEYSGSNGITGSGYENNLYLVGDIQGNVRTSTDGINWPSSDSGLPSTTSSRLNNFDYSASGIYSACGNNGIVITSTDSTVWTSRTTGVSAQLWSIVSFSDNYVSVGDTGTIIKSTDAIHWETVTSGVTQNLYSVVNRDGLYVVGGQNGALLTSPDGSTWTVRTTTGNEFNDTYRLAYNDTFYIAGQQNPQVAVSTDAIHWESRETTFYVGQFYTVAYAANLFFGGAANGTLLVSPDYAYGVVPEQYSAAGTVGKIDTSTDSVMWELRTSGIAKDINEIEVAAQYESVIQAGTYWTARTADLEQFLVSVSSYTFGNNLHVYTTTGPGYVRTSTDTIVWERRTSGNTSTPEDMIYQDGTFVFVGANGSIFASTDTIHWESRISSLSDTINSIVYGNEFVAVGDNGTCTASTDAVTWILRTTASVSDIFDLIYENGIYVSAGEGFGTICMVSTDSVTWEAQNTGNNNNKLSIEYLNNQYYVIAGGTGAIHVSTDTVTWEIRTTGVSNFTTYVSQYINDVYFLFGGDFSSTGIYLTSTDTIAWQNFKTESLPGLSFQSEIVDNIVVNSGARGISVSTTYDRLGYFPQEPFVAVGDDGKLSCSTDEIHWTSKTKIVNQNVYDLKSTNYADQTYTIGGGYDIAPVGSIWTLRTAETPNYNFNSLAYGNSTFVGTSSVDLDDIETSTDGTTWVSRLPGFTSNAQNVYSDGTNFLAVGNNPSNTSGMITYSTDSITWILRTSGVNASNYQSVYGNNEWVVAAGSGNILHSTDTISWSTRVNPISGDVRQIGYGDGYYLAADSNGVVAASTDSVMWELRTTGASGFSGVATYKNGYYFLSNSGGTGALIVSTNTVEWSKRTLRPSFEGSGNYTRSMAYISGRYFAASDSGSVAVSTDTIAWELSVRVNFAAGFLADNGVDNLVHVSTSNRFVQNSVDVFNDSVLATSTDNITWSSRTTTIDSDYINGIASDGTTTVAVGGGYLEGTLWTVRTSGFTSVARDISYANQTTFITGDSGAMSLSTDAIHWVARTAGTSSRIRDVVYSSVDDLYLSGEQDNVIISTDTIVWEQTDLGTSPNIITSVDYVNNIYIVGGTSGMMRTSTDAIVWETRDTGSTNQLGRVIYQDNQYLLSAASDTIKSSTDTVVWIDRDTGTVIGDFYNLVFGGGLYVADGGAFGTLISSTDSVVWTQRTVGFNSYINKVTYRDVYVITGNNGFVAVSTDTIVWTARTTNIVGNLAGNTYDNNFFIAAGEDGTIATSPVFETRGSISQSTDEIHWTARTSGLDTRIDLNTVRYEDGTYLAGGADGIIITSTDGTSWKVKSSPTSNNINDFVGGNNRLYENGIITSGTKDYVAVGDIGTVLSGNGENISRTVEYFWDTNAASADGIIWTSRTNAGSNYTQNKRTIFNDGLFYSLIDSGSGLSVSTDTVAWTLRTIGIPDTSFNTSETVWQYIEYDETDGSYYLGGGQSSYGRVAYSTDAIVWVDRPPAVGNSNLGNIRAFNGLVLVASVGNSHLEVSDNNGITWSRRTTGLGSIVTYGDFAYFKGLYVSIATGNGCVVSTDTITWTLRTTGLNGTGNLHNTGDYLITNALVGGRKYVFTSSDTISWEGYDTNLGDNVNAFANSEDTLVLSGNSGQHATSQAYARTVVSDGSGIEPSLNGGVGSGGLGGQVYGNRFKAWSIRTTNGYINAAESEGGRLVAYHAGRYILTGLKGEGAIQTSTDSIVWEIPEFDFLGVSGLTANDNSATSGAVANNDEYVILQFYNNMWASTDTITWQLRTVSNISSGQNSNRRWGSWDGSTYFLYANGQNGLKVSTDTVVWTQRTLGFATGIAYNLIKGGELYVAAGGNFSNGELFVSTDTIAWEERAVPNPLDTNDITALTYSDRDGLYLIGETGDVAVSTDTIVWTLRTTGNTTNSYDIVYANGLYFGGTGSNAQLIYSTDTVAWELFIPNEFESKSSDDVGYVNGIYYNVTSTVIGFTSNIDYPTLAGNGFDGTGGGGGGGGSYDPDGIKWGLGGSGGNGYVKITWW